MWMTRNCRSHATRSHELASKHSIQGGLGLGVPGHSTSAIGNLSKDSPIRDPAWTEGSTTFIEDGSTSSPSVYEPRTPASTQSRESPLYACDAGPIYLGDAEPDQLSATHYENTDYEVDKGHPLQGAAQLSITSVYTAPCRGATCSPAQGLACLRDEASDSDCPSSHQTSSSSDS